MSCCQVMTWDILTFSGLLTLRSSLLCFDSLYLVTLNHICVFSLNRRNILRFGLEKNNFRMKIECRKNRVKNWMSKKSDEKLNAEKIQRFLLEFKWISICLSLSILWYLDKYCNFAGFYTVLNEMRYEWHFFERQVENKNFGKYWICMPIEISGL